MLQQTFLHLPGIGKKTESSLHQQGILSWHDFFKQDEIAGFSKKRLLFCKDILRASKNALLADDAVFFASLLPLAEHYRAFSAFQEHALYLDVEVDKRRAVTVVTITNGLETKVLVRGVNLSKEELLRALRGCKLLITYNGSSFDLPLLEKQFSIKWKSLHVDLQTVAQRKGFVGGLKEVERAFGLTRDYEEKLSIVLKGGDPALLYRMWRGSGDEYYLRLLLEYNEADAYHLFLLAKKLLGGLLVAASA